MPMGHCCILQLGGSNGEVRDVLGAGLPLLAQGYKLGKDCALSSSSSSHSLNNAFLPPPPRVGAASKQFGKPHINSSA